MSQETPTPRQELGARVTALLLGELPADQAAALQQAIARDPELAKLYERLKQTVALVRETESSPAAELAAQPAPLALGDDRRQKLLARFKTVAPKEFAKPQKRPVHWALPMSAAAVIIGVIGVAVLFYGSFHQRNASVTAVDQTVVWSAANGALGKALADLRPKLLPFKPARTQTDVLEKGRETTELMERELAQNSSPGTAQNGQPKMDLFASALPAFEHGRSAIVLPHDGGAGEAQDSSPATSEIRSARRDTSGVVALDDTAVQMGYPAQRALDLVSPLQSASLPPSESLVPENQKSEAGITVQVPSAEAINGTKGLAANITGGRYFFSVTSGKTVELSPSTAASAPPPLETLTPHGEIGFALSPAGASAAPSLSAEGNTPAGTRRTPEEISLYRGRSLEEVGKRETEKTVTLGSSAAPSFETYTLGLSGSVATTPPPPSPPVMSPKAAADSELAFRTRNGFGGGAAQGEIKLAQNRAPGGVAPSTGLPMPVTGLEGPAVQEEIKLGIGPSDGLAKTKSEAPAEKITLTGITTPGLLGANNPLVQRSTSAADIPAEPSLTTKGLPEPQSTARFKNGDVGDVLAADKVQRFTGSKISDGFSDAVPVAPGNPQVQRSTSAAVDNNASVPPPANSPVVGYNLQNATPEQIQTTLQDLFTRSKAPPVRQQAGDAFLFEKADGLSPGTPVADDRKALVLGDVPVAGTLFKSALDTSGNERELAAAASDRSFTVTNVSTSGYLGRMERGTPWQSIYTGTPADQSQQGGPSNPYSLNVVGYVNVPMTNGMTVASSDFAQRSYQAYEVNGGFGRIDAPLVSSAPSFSGKPTAANPQGFYPGTSLPDASGVRSHARSEIALPPSQARSSEDAYYSYGHETKQAATVAGVEEGRPVQLAEMDKVASAPSAPAAASASETAVNEAVIRPTYRIVLRQKLADANEAIKKRDIAAASKLYDDASELAHKIGSSGIEDEVKQIARAGSELENLKEKTKNSEADIAKRSAPAPIPQPEIQSCDNAFSTFSLNVSDVSFKLAAASLEKGVMPDPSTIRSEEFINAFDYRDPEPSAGVPIGFAWDRARYPFAQNRDLLRFSLKTAALGRQPGRPLNVVLLLDNSGSMERADRVQIIHEALRVLATQLKAQDTLSVVTFARTPRLWVDGVPGSQADKVVEEVSGLTPEGGTNLEEAMNLAYQTALRHYLANGINRVVLLTDGAANLGNVEPDALKKKVEDHRKQGVALDCFGIGWEGYNDDLLEVLSRNGDGRYGFLNTPEEAATEFAGQLAGALHVAAADVKTQIEFNPNRVTAWRQIGYAKHQLTKEQFRDNTVDAAEIGAAESGNALYVIAVNPAGEGPLGTVRVRYKVPGTTDYRKQEWAVPYKGNAAALDQAAPAMRLASTASAFSEWLVSSPYATEVTPDSLLGYLGGVPEVYGADARPKKLEWMIRQAKSVAGK
ncbi:MAG TPA: von Willebrand factor type A domain-containing protein [Candidatus Binatia bacterium]|nr:von Willebrand factor type A domain-containing protein [Candidatus Binatia bacterium]